MVKTNQKQYLLILNNNQSQRFNRKTNRSSSKSQESHAEVEQIRHFYVKNLKNNFKPETAKQNKDNAQKIIKKKIVLGMSRCQSPIKQTKHLENGSQIQVTRNQLQIQKCSQVKMEPIRSVDQICQVNLIQKQDQDYCLLKKANAHLQIQIKALKLQVQNKELKILQLQELTKQLNQKLEKMLQYQHIQSCCENTVTTMSFTSSHQTSFFSDEQEIPSKNTFGLDYTNNQESIFKYKQQLKSMKIQLQCERRKSHMQLQNIKQKKNKQIQSLKKKYSDFLSKYEEQMKKTFSCWASNNFERSQQSIQLQYSSDQEGQLQQNQNINII